MCICVLPSIPICPPPQISFNFYLLNKSNPAKAKVGSRKQRKKYYAYVLRSDPQAAQMAYEEYKSQMQIIRTEYINVKSYMTDTRINVNAW